MSIMKLKEELGTPGHIANMLVNAWKAKRVVIKDGELSRPVTPQKSIPQGDPCAPAAFAGVTSPWGLRLQHAGENIHAIAWVDD